MRVAPLIGQRKERRMRDKSVHLLVLAANLPFDKCRKNLAAVVILLVNQFIVTLLSSQGTRFDAQAKMGSGEIY